MVWCDVVWCGVVWCGVVWCGVVLCGVVWSRTLRVNITTEKRSSDMNQTARNSRTYCKTNAMGFNENS